MILSKPETFNGTSFPFDIFSLLNSNVRWLQSLSLNPAVGAMEGVGPAFFWLPQGFSCGLSVALISGFLSLEHLQNTLCVLNVLLIFLLVLGREIFSVAFPFSAQINFPSLSDCLARFSVSLRLCPLCLSSQWLWVFCFTSFLVYQDDRRLLCSVSLGLIFGKSFDMNMFDSLNYSIIKFHSVSTILVNSSDFGWVKATIRPASRDLLVYLIQMILPLHASPLSSAVFSLKR